MINQLIQTSILISTALTSEPNCFIECLCDAGRTSGPHQHSQRDNSGSSEKCDGSNSIWLPHTTWVAGHSHKLPPCVLRTDSNPLSKSLYPNINKAELSRIRFMVMIRKYR